MIRYTVMVILVLLALSVAAVAEVTVVQSPDRSVSVTTPIYVAHIDAKGDLTDLAVKGARAFAHKFGDPGKPPTEAPSVNVNNKLVAVRSGGLRTEYTFGDDSIHVTTEGYSFECQLDPSLKAVVVPGGKGGPAAAGVYPNSSALVLSNGLTVAYSIPFHSGGLRMVPTFYCNGTKKSGDMLEFDLKLGAPVEAVQLLSAILLAPVGSGYGNLHDGGNQGSGIVHFPAAVKIQFDSAQQNLSSEQMDLTYQIDVLDHRIAGKSVFSDKKSATLAPTGSSELKWSIPVLGPGFYYLTLSAWKGQTKLTDVKQTFAVDLAGYTHQSTRPADFKAFWGLQERKLASVPTNAKVELISDAKNPDKAYEVFLDVPGGKLHGCLEVPAKLSTAPSQFGSLLPGPLGELMAKAKKPDYKAPDHVALTVDLPEDGTYSRWNGPEDNNNLTCILAWLRGIDFLAARPEVKPSRIMAVGASRTGGLTLIVAALRPNNICAANGFVQTSCGLSWTDKAYAGWGKSPDATNAAAWQKFAAEAAYVDPVNFVADVKCPAIFAYGIDDDLSHPQGIEAAYHLCASSWKRISRDGGGHQFSKGCQQIQQDMMKAIDAAPTASPDQTRTLKDH